MKLLPNKTFPHPVLRSNSDDYCNRQFQATRQFSVKEDVPVLSFNFTINEEEITKLLKEGKAIFSLEIYCPITFMRHVFTTNNNSGKFVLNKGNLYGQVEVNTFVICTECVKNYTSNNFNEEFKKGSLFDLLPGDVLAATDTEIYYWDTDLTAPLATVFDIVANNTIPIGTYGVDTDSDKIKIQMHPEDKNRLEWMRQSSDKRPLAMFVYFPIVVEVLRQMKEGGNDSSENTKWYRSIEYKIGELGKDLQSSEPFNLAQELLQKPLEYILPKKESDA